jgi:hypothetical protein
MENRNALIVDAELTTADGYAERATALEMLARLPASGGAAPSPATRTTTPAASSPTPGARVHPARRAERERQPALRDRRAHHPPPGHTVSAADPQTVEEPFGWMKTIGGGHKLRYIGRQRNRAWFKMNAAVYNLIRITALDAQPA